MMSLRVKTSLLFLLIVIHLLVSWFTIVPGFLLPDEATLHTTVQHFSETGGFDLHNGYREFPSRELLPTLTSIHNGRIVSQYPYLYPLIATPFYRLAGIHGLFWLNALVFPAILWCCYAISQTLFHDRHLSLNACFIFLLATYSWQYSQELWPHILLTTALMAVLYCGIRAWYASASRQAFWLAMLSGLLAGAAIGIRLDAVFILPTLLLPFLFGSPWRPKEALAIMIGTLPGLLALSLTNQIKFNTFSPLSYGGALWGGRSGIREIFLVLPFLMLGIGSVLGIWLITRPFMRTYLRRYVRFIMIAGVIVLLVFVLRFPRWQQPLRRRIILPVRHTIQMLIDFRFDSKPQTSAMNRSSTGAIVYVGGVKKSFLQSCPYLTLLVLPCICIFRRKEEKQKLFWLLTFIVTFPVFFLYYGWEGGVGLNLRYLLPILPATSIVTAYVWRDLVSSLPVSQKSQLPSWFGIIGIQVVFFYFWVVRRNTSTIFFQELFYLTFPLILGAVIMLTLTIREIGHPALGKFYPVLSTFYNPLTWIAILTIFATMMWAGLVEFFYDYPVVRRYRMFTFDVATTSAAAIPDDSLLFVEYGVPFWGVKEFRRQLRIAYPYRDNFRSFHELAAFHFKHGRAVYGAFYTWGRWESLKEKGLLDEYEIIPIQEFQPYEIVLCQIVPKS